MVRVFEHFHLSLIEREQQGLFVAPMIREDWLRALLSNPFQFRHMGNTFYWIPMDWSDSLITAVIERMRTKSLIRNYPI